MSFLKDSMTNKIIAPALEWPRLLEQARALAPEAFDEHGNPLNLIHGEWGFPGHPKPFSVTCRWHDAWQFTR